MPSASMRQPIHSWPLPLWASSVPPRPTRPSRHEAASLSVRSTRGRRTLAIWTSVNQPLFTAGPLRRGWGGRQCRGPLHVCSPCFQPWDTCSPLLLPRCRRRSAEWGFPCVISAPLSAGLAKTRVGKKPSLTLCSVRETVAGRFVIALCGGAF